MTMDAKQGAENVLRAIQHYVAGELPAKVATLNAATSAALQAYLKGPYVFDGTKQISVTRNNAAASIDYAPAGGTYTATELAALLNGDAGFSAALTAAAVQSSSYLEIHETVRGTAGSLKVEDTTGNALLGWQAGYTSNYYPVRDLVEIAIQFNNVEPVAYPALHLSCGDARETEGAPQMMEYDIELRLFEVVQDATFGDQLLVQLTRMARVIRELLAPVRGSRSLGGQVNGLDLNSYAMPQEIKSDGLHYRAQVDFDLTVKVQED